MIVALFEVLRKQSHGSASDNFQKQIPIPIVTTSGLSLFEANFQNIPACHQTYVPAIKGQIKVVIRE